MAIPYPSASDTSAPAALLRELERAQALHADRQRDPALAQALDRLGAWQSRRLGATYADLAAMPRYADAIAFFQSDLYGGDFARRDADLARVVPLMVRMLPERVIATVAQAMELNALSQELDRALLARLPAVDRPFTVAEYCRAYRLMGNRPGRERQIGLIIEIGAALDRFVRMPLLHTALVLMRQPARMAGMLDGLPALVDVVAVRPGQAGDDRCASGRVLRAADVPRDRGDRCEVVGRGGGKPGLDHVDAQSGQLTGDLELLRAGERGSGRLLTVPKCRVEDANVGVWHGTGSRRGVLTLSDRRAEATLPLVVGLPWCRGAA